MRVFPFLILAGCAVSCRAGGGETEPPSHSRPHTVGATKRSSDDMPGLLVARSETGRYEVRLLPAGGTIPKNEYFEVEVGVFLVSDPDQLLTGVEVGFHAWMPEHGHGTLREPRLSKRDDGSLLVTDLLLHRGGSWEVSVTIEDHGELDRVRFDVEL